MIYPSFTISSGIQEGEKESQKMVAREPEEVVPVLSKDCDYFITTTNAAEALMHLSQFIELCKINECKEYTLRLKLRPTRCSDLFKESIYTTLTEMASFELKDLKARWTIQVY